jgi:hypothetical protein
MRRFNSPTRNRDKINATQPAQCAALAAGQARSENCARSHAPGRVKASLRSSLPADFRSRPPAQPGYLAKRADAVTRTGPSFPWQSQASPFDCPKIIRLDRAMRNPENFLVINIRGVRGQRPPRGLRVARVARSPFVAAFLTRRGRSPRSGNCIQPDGCNRQLILYYAVALSSRTASPIR